MIPCPYFYYFGIECLGCGFQRSVLSLIEFNLAKSIQYFPGLIPFILFSILELLRVIGLRWKNQNRLTMVFGLAAFGIQLVNYFLRVFGLIPWACEI
jgi:hypothetical protein